MNKFPGFGLSCCALEPLTEIEVMPSKVRRNFIRLRSRFQGSLRKQPTRVPLAQRKWQTVKCDLDSQDQSSFLLGPQCECFTDSGLATPFTEFVVEEVESALCKAAGFERHVAEDRMLRVPQSTHHQHCAMRQGQRCNGSVGYLAPQEPF